ncbi:hypothetical protein B2K_09050 [Paenibacillus mucilaginosus K02]|uniref:Uncharacterized protein n=1 Tax=Paenibacillus mucilaginosus K02 TaxID=997761 RepID=I0BER7_9BACL|nr:hypothetical protein B2K_09050 [Paenibacillus mucilaginosus K02]
MQVRANQFCRAEVTLMDRYFIAALLWYMRKGRKFTFPPLLLVHFHPLSLHCSEIEELRFVI